MRVAHIVIMLPLMRPLFNSLMFMWSTVDVSIMYIRNNGTGAHYLHEEVLISYTAFILL